MRESDRKTSGVLFPRSAERGGADRSWRVSDFAYELPPERIAHRPLARRDASRLMVLDDRASHRTFSDLPQLLRAGDLLVLNDTKVIPARLRGRRETGGKVELLLVEEEPSANPSRRIWRCLVGSSRPPAPGETLRLGSGLTGRVIERPEGGEARVELSAPRGVSAALERQGEVPLPPYIRRPEGADVSDRERYQTVYARDAGAVAAPTAGLHFTAELLERLREAGVGRADLTLHVGPGTFQPVRADRVEEHRMHAEFFRIPEATARAVNRTRAAGGRVVAVGTTVVRALEHAGRTGRLSACEGWCDLFILPGFRFRQTDLLLTNFHLPGSTLLMLVAAFAGRERTLSAYEEATRRGYRFYSYGDAMLVSPGGPD